MAFLATIERDAYHKAATGSLNVGNSRREAQLAFYEGRRGVKPLPLPSSFATITLSVIKQGLANLSVESVCAYKIQWTVFSSKRPNPRKLHQQHLKLAISS